VRVRTFRFPPRTLSGWLMFLAAAAVGIVLAVFVGVFLLVLTGAVLLASPFLGKRRVPPRPPEAMAPDARPPGARPPGRGRVIDVDAQVSPPRPPD
jgi:hypothetical protein